MSAYLWKVDPIGPGYHDLRPIHLGVESMGGQWLKPTYRMACGVTLSARYETDIVRDGAIVVTCPKCLVAWDKALKKSPEDVWGYLRRAARFD